MQSVFLKRNCVKLLLLLFAKSTSTLTAASAMTAAIRKVFAEKPAEFDPRKYLGPARDNMKKLYIHKIVNVKQLVLLVNWQNNLPIPVNTLDNKNPDGRMITGIFLFSARFAL